MRTRLVLQSNNGAFEVEDLPESNSEIQESNTADRAANPTRSDDSLQPLNASLACGIKQKVIVTPVANPPHPVRPPRRHREKNTNLEAQDDVEDNA